MVRFCQDCQARIPEKATVKFRAGEEIFYFCVLCAAKQPKEAFDEISVYIEGVFCKHR